MSTRRRCSSPRPTPRRAPPKDLFVVDDQLHFVRGTFGIGAVALRAIAQGPTTPGFTSNPFNPNNVPDEHGDPWGNWNPALIGLPVTNDMFNIVNFIRSIYFDSQVTVGLISNVTAFAAGPSGQNPGQPAQDVEDARTGEILTAKQTAAARNFINELAGSRRAMPHGLLYVGRGNLDYIQYQIDHHHPDAWKGYNISYAAKVDSGPMRQWRHDDENVAYPTFELISENVRRRKLGPGGNVIAVHKGLARGLPPLPENGYPSDMPKALKDWPHLNFLTYHSCIQDSFFDDQALAQIQASEAGTRPLLNGVPNIDWVTPFAQLTGRFKNSYGEIGTTFASSVVTFPNGDRAHPRAAAAVQGFEANPLRIGLALVRQPAVADRGALAVPDPRSDRGSLGLSAAGRARQARHPRSEFGHVVRAPPARGCGVWAGAIQLRKPHHRRHEEALGNAAVRQHPEPGSEEGQLQRLPGAIPGHGRRAQEHPVRVDPHLALSRSPEGVASVTPSSHCG